MNQYIPDKKYVISTNSLGTLATRLRLVLLILVFFKAFLVDIFPFVGPLIPPFWTSGDVFPGFQSQDGFLANMLLCLHTIPTS